MILVSAQPTTPSAICPSFRCQLRALAATSTLMVKASCAKILPGRVAATCRRRVCPWRRRIPCRRPTPLRGCLCDVRMLHFLACLLLASWLVPLLGSSCPVRKQWDDTYDGRSRHSRLIRRRPDRPHRPRVATWSRRGLTSRKVEHNEASSPG